MISEVTFARDFSSFWRTATPTIEGFIRRLNSALYDRDYEPLRASTLPSRRSFVNEVAFEAFCKVAQDSKQEGRPIPSENLIQGCMLTVRQQAIKAARDGDYETDLSDGECDDIRGQVSRLAQRLLAVNPSASVLLKPKLPGCGMIDTCSGDIIIGETLFEIKAGDRPFRSVDVKQITTYLALNNVSNKYYINSIGLINPRIGISLVMDVNEFCFQISGRDAAGLMGLIAYSISSGEISR